MKVLNENEIRHEESIVWVKGKSEDYPYLREGEIMASSRSRGVRDSQRKNIVAYSTLKVGAPNNGYAGRFERRIWRFRQSDPYPIERGHPNHENACPCEGVKPSSIKPGKISESGRE